MSAQSLISQGFGGYQGWGDAEADADFRATGGSGKKTTPSSGGVSNGSFSSSPAQNTQDTIANAQALRQFNIDSAQPQIATLQQNKTDLGTQYQNLLASIKGDQQQAVNNATKATNATIASRGLSTQDPMAQGNLANAQSSAAQPYSSLYAQTGIGQAQDQAGLAAQIAALQSGNPEGATSSALSIGGLSQNAAQLGLQQNQQQFSQRYITIPGYGIYDTTNGSLLGGISAGGVSPSGNQIIGQY